MISKLPETVQTIYQKYNVKRSKFADSYLNQIKLISKEHEYVEDIMLRSRIKNNTTIDKLSNKLSSGSPPPTWNWTTP